MQELIQGVEALVGEEYGRRLTKVPPPPFASTSTARRNS